MKVVFITRARLHNAAISEIQGYYQSGAHLSQSYLKWIAEAVWRMVAMQALATSTDGWTEEVGRETGGKEIREESHRRGMQKEYPLCRCFVVLIYTKKPDYVL